MLYIVLTALQVFGKNILTIPLRLTEGWAIPSPSAQLYNILDRARTGI